MSRGAKHRRMMRAHASLMCYVRWYSLLWVVLSLTASTSADEMVVLSPDLITQGFARADADNEPDLEDLGLAVETYRENNLSKALELFEAARSKTSQLPPARLMLALVMLADRKIESSRLMLEQVAVEEPDHPGLYLAFAKIALVQKRATDALLHLQQARQLATKADWLQPRRDWFESSCSSGLAAVAESRGQWDFAREHLLASLKLDPKNVVNRQRLAKALFLLDEHRECYDELVRAARDKPTMEPPALSMARLYDQIGDLQKTELWLERSTKQFPGNVDVQTTYAAWLLDQSRIEAAIAQLTKAAKADPDSRSVRKLDGDIAYINKDFPKAQRIFEQMHSEQPADFMASNQLALTLVELPGEEDRTRALQLATANLQKNPRLAEAHSTYGWISYRLGQNQNASTLR